MPKGRLPLGVIFNIGVIRMIEQFSELKPLSRNPQFNRNEAKVNKILLTLHKSLDDTDRALLEQLSQICAHQYSLAFAEGFYSAAELAADLLRIKCSHRESGE